MTPKSRSLLTLKAGLTANAVLQPWRSSALSNSNNSFRLTFVSGLPVQAPVFARWRFAKTGEVPNRSGRACARWRTQAELLVAAATSEGSSIDAELTRFDTG